MNQLPDPKNGDFPEALKAARESKNLTYSELARAIGISVVMPSRYEKRDHSLFSVPSLDTWRKLNKFFYGDSKDEFSSTKVIDSDGLSHFSVDELVGELKKRGATAVQITF